MNVHLRVVVEFVIEEHEEPLPPASLAGVALPQVPLTEGVGVHPNSTHERSVQTWMYAG